MVVEVRYMLRMLGVPLEDISLLIGDNMSVILNTTLPSSMLKKKHNAIAYHRVREAIATRIINFAHIDSKSNVADILTKLLTSDIFHDLLKSYLFRSVVIEPKMKETYVAASCLRRCRR